ncbi:MAG: hypothetical protein ACRDH5_14610, partial [bacterium]
VEQVKTEVFRELERRFPPDFRNRIDEVVLFAPLARDEVRWIAEHELQALAATLDRSGRRLEVAPGALDRLVDEGYSLAYGARFLKRVIDERVKLPISQQWHAGPSYRVVLEEEKVVVVAATLTGSPPGVATTGVAAH